MLKFVKHALALSCLICTVGCETSSLEPQASLHFTQARLTCHSCRRSEPQATLRGDLVPTYTTRDS